MKQWRRMKEYVEDKVLRSWVWINSEKGQGLIEYALILALIVLVALTFLKLISPKVGDIYSDINANMP